VRIPSSLIDNFGEVSKLREAFAPTEKLYQKLRGEISVLLVDFPDNEAFIGTGVQFTLDASARKMERTVDLVAARKKLGAAGFMEIASVSISALSNLLPKPQVDALTVAEQTGSRTYITTPV
jgi:hypothetical protein